MSQSAAAPAPSPIKMLAIDDRSMTTDLDRAGYRKMGIYVRLATNYEEAEKVLSSEDIDIIVVNMDFTRVDAIQIVKHLKATETWCGIPAILTSVQTTAKIRNAALEAGADLFVEQPLPRQYFIEKLKQLLEQKTRTTERVDVGITAELHFDNKTLKCSIGDLSVSGMLFLTEKTIASGTQVEISFNLPSMKKPIEATGEVVRSICQDKSTPNLQTGLGIRFLSFSGDSDKRLAKYISKTADSSARMIYYL